jgi:hypothetical protein
VIDVIAMIAFFALIGAVFVIVLALSQPIRPRRRFGDRRDWR